MEKKGGWSIGPFWPAFNAGYTFVDAFQGGWAKLPDQWISGGDKHQLWAIDSDGHTPPPGMPFAGWAVASGQVQNGRPWSGAPYHYSIGNQYGYAPNLGTGPFTYTITDGQADRMFLAIYQAGVGDYRAWFMRSYKRVYGAGTHGTDISLNPAHNAPAPAPYPGRSPNPGSWPGHYPSANPGINPVAPGAFPTAPPLGTPRPSPWSPESPDVGPNPGPNPNPAPNPFPNPGPVPGQPPMPNPLPEFPPVPYWPPQAPPLPDIVTHPPPIDVFPTGNPRPQPRPNPNANPGSPGPGVKETKVRMGPIASFIWNAFNPITEGVDFINNLYEALPWKLKRDWYLKNGRQPTPQEKMELIYRNINNLDVGDAINGYIKNQIEDFIYSLGSSNIAGANVDFNRPIGYEAGGGLTGGGGHVNAGDLGAPPDYWPEWLPW